MRRFPDRTTRVNLFTLTQIANEKACSAGFRVACLFVMSILQFGLPDPGVEYRPRPSVYAVIVNDRGQLLAIFKRETFFLPGGGIDDGESEGTALLRECLEETGFEIEIGELLGRADQFCFAPVQQRYFNKLGVFYRAELKDTPAQPVTELHKVCWVLPSEFAARPAHESHLWAVQRAFNTPPPD